MFVLQNAPGLKQQRSFSQLLENYFTNYYHQNIGTPHVKKFLDWLKKNDAELMREFDEDVRAGRLDISKIPGGREGETAYNFMLGAWLGVKYMAHSEQLKVVHWPPLRYAPYNDANANDLMAEKLGGRALGVVLGGLAIRNIASNCKEGAEIFIAGINIAIHEGTHAVPYITWPDYAQHDYGKVTSELGVADVQERLSLPIKSSGSIVNMFAIRNAYVDINRIVASLDEHGANLMMSEYLAHAILPWIKSRLEKNFNLATFAHFRSVEHSQVKLGHLLDGTIAWKDFYEDCNLHDSGLLADIKKAFEAILPQIRSKTDLEALEIYSNEMTKVFGTPTGRDYPYGYSMLYSEPGGNKFLMGMTPVKKERDGG